ncbi:alpha/beta hydrolase family esterase [Streptomyces sp. NPDC001970]
MTSRSTPSRRATTMPGRLVALALGSTLAAGCTTATGPASPPAPAGSSQGGSRAPAAADTREQVRVDGGTREYLLHRPGTNGGGRKPLVIAFHGRGSTASGMRETSGLDKAAGARDMLIACPEGLRRGWGAGTAVTGQRPDPDADVRFTEALVDQLVRTGQADPERVYVVGFSNGGSMALRVAAQRPGLWREPPPSRANSPPDPRRSGPRDRSRC